MLLERPAYGLPDLGSTKRGGGKKTSKYACLTTRGGLSTQRPPENSSKENGKGKVEVVQSFRRARPERMGKFNRNRRCGTGKESGNELGKKRRVIAQER